MAGTTTTLLGTLVDLVEQGRATLLTGPQGSGKTHVLRALGATLARSGRSAPIITAGTWSAGIPLGVFAGIGELPAEAWSSPASIVDAFARDRSVRVLLVDDVAALDEASLYVVCQLVSTTRIPAVLTSRDLTGTPASIRRLYDSGDLTETPLGSLSDPDASGLVSELLSGGTLTPSAQSAVVAAGEGNPLVLREIVRGSVDSGRLVETPHGWDLVGNLAPTPRLSQLLGSRFDEIDARALDAAAMVAIAGDLPNSALDDAARLALSRVEIVEPAEGGWSRLANPLDAEHLRSRFSAAAWHELTREVVHVLRGAGTGRPQAVRRADLLALEHGLELDLDATVRLAEHALGALDPRLALRAASVVVETRPRDVGALRVAGLAASTLGEGELADGYLDRAKAEADDDETLTAVALAMAQHLGLHRHDALGALASIDAAIAKVTREESLAHLYRARSRWGAVAGLGAAAPPAEAHGTEGEGLARRASGAVRDGKATHDHVPPPEGIPDPGRLTHPEAAMGLIAAGVASVISGPLDEASAMLEHVNELPDALLDLVPGGRPLIELTQIMALSYTGDVRATRLRLEHTIERARRDQPESLGIWEYALGVVELFSADAERAYTLARAATTHLAWRDTTGLMPAAQALAGASALATGREIESSKELEAISETASADPKVVMLRGWTEAWQHRLERRPELAAQTLLDTARGLLAAQHTFLAGMVAHCVARLDRRCAEAAEVLGTASSLAGGGLLTLLVRHAEAMRDRDHESLESIAADARELGLDVTAADTWTWLAEAPTRPSPQAKRLLVVVQTERPTMALWRGPTERSMLLTERERQVAELAAQRLTAKEIALRHGVSVHTVNNQLTSVFRKLGISSRAELRELIAIAGTSRSPQAEDQTPSSLPLGSRKWNRRPPGNS